LTTKTLREEIEKTILENSLGEENVGQKIKQKSYEKRGPLGPKETRHYATHSVGPGSGQKKRRWGAK